MSRVTGVSKIKTIEYVIEYNRLCKLYGDPLEVLFKMLNSRKQMIKLAAARELISYRYPKQAIIKAEVEHAEQLIMSWDETLDLPPGSPIEINQLPDPGVKDDA